MPKRRRLQHWHCAERLARTARILSFRVATDSKEVVIHKQELASGVYLEDTLTKEINGITF